MSPEINNLITAVRPKKRVLFIITQSEFGGAQKFIINLAQCLDKERFQLHVAMGKDGDSEIFLRNLDNLKIPITKLRHAKRNVSPIKDLLVIFEIRRLIKKLNPDILFLNSSKTSVWGPMAVYFPTKIIPTPKIIYRIGGWSFNDPRLVYARWLWIILEKIFARKKDIIIVNSRHDFRQAEKLGIKPKQNLELVYNGIDLKKMEFFDKDEAKIKLFEKLTQKSGNFLKAKTIIGTIANFYKTKGLGYLIEAAKSTEGELSVFVIIGDGPLKESLKLKVKNLKLENKVLFTGKIPDAYKYLKAFDIFLLPSVKEGFPWVILEAMAAKLPIIATPVGAVPEIIENGRNGIIVAQKDSKAIVEAIKTIVTNDKLRQELEIQAHQTVLFNFTSDKMVEKIEKLL